MHKRMTLEQAEAVARYLAQGGRIVKLRPSLAPVCVPVPMDHRPIPLGQLATMALERLRRQA